MSVEFKPLPNKKYSIIYCDPPWDYKGQSQHGGEGTPDTGSALSYYPTVTLNDLKLLNIIKVSADDCLLFMWATNPHLDQAIELGKTWGFEWSTVAFVWNKMNPNPGFYTMSQCELVLVFKRGKIPQPRGLRNIRQLVEVPRTRHSEKPHEVRSRIEKMFPVHNKIELFARKKFDGWDCWGNEV